MSLYFKQPRDNTEQYSFYNSLHNTTNKIDSAGFVSVQYPLNIETVYKEMIQNFRHQRNIFQFS